MLILDTHAWIWLAEGGARLSSRVVATIGRWAGQGKLGVSAISVWEIAMLQRKGRIALDRPCLEWVSAALQLHGLQLLEISPAVAVQSENLPGRFHGDPADRMIVATAKLQAGTIATRDRSILAYVSRHEIAALRV